MCFLFTVAAHSRQVTRSKTSHLLADNITVREQLTEPAVSLLASSKRWTRVQHISCWASEWMDLFAASLKIQSLELGLWYMADWQKQRLLPFCSSSPRFHHTKGDKSHKSIYSLPIVHDIKEKGFVLRCFTAIKMFFSTNFY